MNIQTSIWLEEPEPDNRFATMAAFCHGYDLQELQTSISWEQMVYLLFKGEIPSQADTDLMLTLSIALANPGPRDPMVHAAMCGGIGGSVAASSLMAALAVGAGQNGGAREVFLVMQDLAGLDVEAWTQRVKNRRHPDGTWPELDHVPGFDINGVSTPTPVKLFLAKNHDGREHLSWLRTNLYAIEAIAGHPLAMTAVVAATFLDLGFTPEQGEMLHLIMRLPGCAAHALEQSKIGFKNFPFPPVDLQDDPKGKT